jgi:hypothetical protein
MWMTVAARALATLARRFDRLRDFLDRTTWAIPAQDPRKSLRGTLVVAIWPEA